jgi:chitin synthase
MTDRPTLPSVSSHSSHDDPFAGRPRQTHFNEPERPYHPPSLANAYESTTTLRHDFDGQGDYQNDDYIEKVPLTSGQGLSGTAGFYPPRSVSAPLHSWCLTNLSILIPHGPIIISSHADPDSFGDPYPLGRPDSVLSTSTNGVDSAWRRRQTIKRGVTRKVKLTHGNFIAEYAVPTPVFSAIDPKWSSTKSTEFSYVPSLSLIF